MHRLLWPAFFVAALVYLGLIIWAKEKRGQKQRGIAYEEGIGEEYDLELNRLLEVQRFAPKNEVGPNPHIQALDNVRLQQRKIAKTLVAADKPLSHILNTAFIMMWRRKWSRLSRPFFARNKLSVGKSELRGDRGRPLAIPAFESVLGFHRWRALSSAQVH